MLSRKGNGDMQSSKISSILGKDTIFEGNFHAKETIRIDGLVKGDVTVEETLILGTTGKIVGNVQAVCIMVGGQVQGDMTAKEKIEFSATGKVVGNLWTKKLIIDENAVFQGNCNMEVQPAGKTAAAPVQQAVLSALSAGEEMEND